MRHPFSSRSIVAGLALVTLHAALAAQQATPPRDALRLGFSTQRLARIDSAVQRAVDGGEIGGAVALVLRGGQTVYARAEGSAAAPNSGAAETA